MFEGLAEALAEDIHGLHAALRALPPADNVIEIDRRFRAIGNLATAARKVLQLAATVREAAKAQEENEDGMAERLDDPDVMERKHREIDALLARSRQCLDPGTTAAADDARRTRGLSQELADERQPRAA